MIGAEAILWILAYLLKIILEFLEAIFVSFPKTVSGIFMWFSSLDTRLPKLH